LESFCILKVKYINLANNGMASPSSRFTESGWLVASF